MHTEFFRELRRLPVPTISPQKLGRSSIQAFPEWERSR